MTGPDRNGLSLQKPSDVFPALVLGAIALDSLLGEGAPPGDGMGGGLIALADAMLVALVQAVALVGWVAPAILAAMVFYAGVRTYQRGKGRPWTVNGVFPATWTGRTRERPEMGCLNCDESLSLGNTIVRHFGKEIVVFGACVWRISEGTNEICDACHEADAVEYALRAEVDDPEQVMYDPDADDSEESGEESVIATTDGDTQTATFEMEYPAGFTINEDWE